MNPADMTPEQMMHEQKMIAKDMDDMIRSPGYQRINLYINQELESAFAVLQAAHTGDSALEAKANFILLRRLRDLPTFMKESAMRALIEMEKEVPEVVIKPSRNRMP